MARRRDRNRQNYPVLPPGYDPNIGFEKLSFSIGGDCGGITPTNTPVTPSPTAVSSCQPITSDFSAVKLGASVEGMGKVIPNLNIDAKGTAVRVLQGNAPFLYSSTVNGQSVDNAGVLFGGFGDPTTQKEKGEPRYTFTFATGYSVSEFTLDMLDFGDFNPKSSKTHVVKMTAYDAAGAVLAEQTLSYTSNGGTVSPEYGSMLIAGDATTALPGQPGNYSWRVTGNGITKVILSFPAGYDPNIAFEKLAVVDNLCQ